jgi:cation transport ATPase
MFDFFHEVEAYPYSWNVFSIYLLIMLFITMGTIYKFGLTTYKNAYYNFKDYKMLNMETLVTLGSLSAFIMALFVIISYTIQEENDPDHNDMLIKKNKMDRHMKIVMIVHMFETSALILAIVTLGKYLEG